MTRVPAFHTLPDTCEFYFVRHGESESNKDGKIQGHTDSPLSALGREHAEAAGRWFADRGIDTVLTSPLSRARQTASAISRAAGAPEPHPLDELIELDTGIYSDVSIRELASVDPELFRRFRVHSWEVVPEAERISSLLRRAHAVWNELVRRAQEGSRRVVCVSHGGMIQWLIKATVGSEEQRWMPLFDTSNCGIFLFRAESTLPGHHHHSDDTLSDTNAMAADDEEASSGVGGAFGAGAPRSDRRPAAASPAPDESAANAGLRAGDSPAANDGPRASDSPAANAGPRASNEPPAPGTGYYGVWAIMNLVPY